MGLENLMELQILIEGIDHFTEPFRQMENTITGAEAKFKSINSTMKMMGKSAAEIDAINSSLQKMADQKAFSNIAGDLQKIGMAKGDIQTMEQSYMRMAQHQRDMAKAQEGYAAGKDLAMKGVGNLAVGGAGAFGIFELVKQAGEFQSNMAVIQDSTGATTKQMQGLGDAVMNASAQVSKFNDMQMAQIAQTLSSGGFGNVKDVQSLMLPTAKYAEVQMYEHKASDPIEATKQAIEMAHTFGNYNPKSFESFLNNFNKYSMMQPGDSSQLAQTLTYLAPTANTMHMKQSDTMALAAIDNVLGLTGSHGGTNSADMILRLIPGLVGGGPKVTRDKKGRITKVSDPKAWAAMQDLGFIDKKGNSQFFNKDGSIKDLSGMLGTMIADSKGKSPKDLMKDYSAIFGVQGGRAAAILSNPRSLEQLGKMRTQLGKTKSMDQINKDLQATPEGQLNLLKSNSMTLMLRLGQQLAISLNPAIAQVNKLLSAMLKFSQAHPGITKLIGDFALFAVGGKIAEGFIKIFVGHFKMLSAAIKMFKLTTAAGELTKFGTIISGIGKLFPLLTGPWGILIGAVVVGAVLVITHWKQISTWVQQHFGNTIPTILKTLSNTFQTVWSAIKNGVEAAWNYIKPTILDGIQTIHQWWNQYWPEIQQVFKEVWDVMKAILTPVIDFFKTEINAGLAFIKGAWQNGWNAIKDALKLVWDLIKGVVKTSWDLISGIVSTGLDIFTGHWGKAWDDVKSTFINVWDDITGTFGNLLTDALNFGTHFVESIASGISGAIGSVTKAVSGVVSSVTSFFTGGSTPNVAKHATGGIFNTPHLGLVAEAGPEAIIPLSDPSRGLALWQQAGMMLGGFTKVNSMRSASLPSGGYGSGGSPTIIVYASGNITRNERELGDIVSRQILNKVKMQGRI